MRFAVPLTLLAVATFASCDDDADAYTRTERPHIDHGPTPSDPLAAEVHAWGADALPRMTPEPLEMSGTLRTNEVQDHLVVLLGTHCYTFLAVGGEGVRELELRLVDPAGVVAFYDSDAGRRASLGLREQICPDAPGAFQLRVRVFDGAGPYVAKAYGYQAY
ncbi:MAG: hypothetical protein KF901_07870 [Myxococcales bacterium]|nr:hypothetical protein [Myxococcales bacterium]